jgi:hypothetical protein
MSALDTLIKHSLSLVSTSHLASHVVHLLAWADRAIFMNDDLFWALGKLISLFSCLHPLFPLVELLSIDNFVSDQIGNRGQLLAETTLSMGLVGG